MRQRDKVKITYQSEALFKQKRWFKRKTNDPVASRLEMGLQLVATRYVEMGLYGKSNMHIFTRSITHSGVGLLRISNFDLAFYDRNRTYSFINHVRKLENLFVPAVKTYM